MWYLKEYVWCYSPVRLKDHERYTASCDVNTSAPGRPWPRHVIFPLLLMLFAAGLLLGSLLDRKIPEYLKSVKTSNLYNKSGPCTEPATRREWRSLALQERTEYITAVQCLSKHKSILDPSATMYDDFGWIHSHVGQYSHTSAAFLAWHRYFIHIYESVLQNQCGYTGNLPYWDWTLDWEDIFSSPVWGTPDGFGGNGDIRLKASLNYGRCVTDGPFADLQLSFAGHQTVPHCLTRGFETEGLSNFSGHGVSPVAIDAILAHRDYWSFWQSVEEGPHDTIPNLIRGDFFLLTAPNEPTFFLHHAALDRLWWLWQQRDPQKRLQEYVGPAQNGSSIGGSLQDSLPMVGFAEDIRVADVMNTEAGLLYYRY